MKFNIEDITADDVKKVMNYDAAFGELSKAHDLIEIIKPKFESNDTLWNMMCMVLYSYKLGVIQGKREERAKHKRKSYRVGGAN